MDHLGGRRMGRDERREFAKMKQAQEDSDMLGDDRKVKKLAYKYKQEIARQRKAAGLDG